MSSRITLTVALFGAFRPYADGAPLTLEIANGTSVADIKKEIGAMLQRRHPHFTNHRLVNESALADEKQVLAESATIARDSTLALLPPVCGG